MENTEIKQITVETNPDIWAILQPPEKTEPRCKICGCTKKEGAWGIEKDDVCHQCYYDALAEIEED